MFLKRFEKRLVAIVATGAPSSKVGIGCAFACLPLGRPEPCLISVVWLIGELCGPGFDESPEVFLRSEALLRGESREGTLGFVGELDGMAHVTVSVGG